MQTPYNIPVLHIMHENACRRVLGRLAQGRIRSYRGNRQKFIGHKVKREEEKSPKMKGEMKKLTLHPNRSSTTDVDLTIPTTFSSSCTPEVRGIISPQGK